MSWLASIFIGLLTGGLGLGLAGVIANDCVSWYRISSFAIPSEIDGSDLHSGLNF